MSKNTRIAVFAGVFLVAVSVPAVYFWGPRSETTYACALCGREKVQKKCVGLTYYAEEFDTDDSRWYQARGLKSHGHDWQYLCSNERDWAGGGIHIDGFGPFLYPLHLLREAEKRTDEAEFAKLVQEYYGICGDRIKIKDFVQHCDDIIGPNHPFR